MAPMNIGAVPPRVGSYYLTGRTGDTLGRF